MSNESSIEKTTTTEVNCRIDGYFCEALGSGRVQRYWRQSLGVLWFPLPQARAGGWINRRGAVRGGGWINGGGGGGCVNRRVGGGGAWVNRW
jgi:hypothetical protein